MKDIPRHEYIQKIFPKQFLELYFYWLDSISILLITFYFLLLINLYAE